MLSNNNCDFDLSFDECMAGADRTKCARLEDPRCVGMYYKNNDGSKTFRKQCTHVSECNQTANQIRYVKSGHVKEFKSYCCSTDFCNKASSIGGTQGSAVTFMLTCVVIISFLLRC